MKTLAIKSLTGTPQATVLSKNPATQGPMRDWVLAFLGRKAHARDQAIKMEDDVRASSFPDVTARQLRAVLAVAEYRSFIAAAAFLKTSQPALTRTIKQIAPSRRWISIPGNCRLYPAMISGSATWASDMMLDTMICPRCW